jgi:hypothetical protein
MLDRERGLAESVSDERAMAARWADEYFLDVMAMKRDWCANVTNGTPLHVIPIVLMNLL